MGVILASIAVSMQPSCTMAKADRAWLDDALGDWRVAERDILKLPSQPLPQIVAIDARCTYIARPVSGAPPAWLGRPHGDPVDLPDGKQAPIGPISFAAPDAAGGRTGYFAMSLPSVWRRAGVSSGLGLERLMDSVLLHEMTHTRQFYFANPMMTALTRRYGLPDSIGDDSLQDAFKDNPAYVAAYEAERDALYAAAAAPDDASARRLAAKAYRLLEARRARFFTGAAAKWAPLDDLFLDMEGLAQWTGYAWLVSPKGTNLPRAFAIEQVRRKRAHWTQDEGLALFLTVDRLVPDWRAKAFADPPWLAEALLRAAATDPKSGRIADPSI